MYYALISTDGDVLDSFEDLDAAYAAADETPDSFLAWFRQPGRPEPPPPRVYRRTYGEVTTETAIPGLSGDTLPLPQVARPQYTC